jgi:hypothetical protein
VTAVRSAAQRGRAGKDEEGEMDGWAWSRIETRRPERTVPTTRWAAGRSDASLLADTGDGAHEWSETGREGQQ